MAKKNQKNETVVFLAGNFTDRRSFSASLGKWSGVIALVCLSIFGSVVVTLLPRQDSSPQQETWRRLCGRSRQVIEKALFFQRVRRRTAATQGLSEPWCGDIPAPRERTPFTGFTESRCRLAPGWINPFARFGRSYSVHTQTKQPSC